MKQHYVRLIVIAVAFVASLVCLTVLIANGITEGTGFGALLGATTLLGTAFTDAAAVERRRRTPGRKAVEDDVG